MHHFKSNTFVTEQVNQAIKDRFYRDYGVTTLTEYFDYLDEYTTRHLELWKAKRVLKTTGKQRRNAILKLENEELIIGMPIEDSRTGSTVWAESDLHTFLNVLDSGADGAWSFAYKGKGQKAGQVRITVPLGGRKGPTHATVARIIANAGDGQQARVKDRNPLNLRQSNIVLIGNPLSTVGRVGRAKTDTRAQLRLSIKHRASLANNQRKDRA